MARSAAIRLSPLDRAIADHEAGRLARAAAGYKRILDHDPANPDALHLLGLLACDTSQPDAALAWIEAAICRAPDRAAFHNSRGRALAALNRPDAAEQAFHEAWRLQPGSAQIANNLGCALRDQANPAALVWFRRACQLAPTTTAIALNLA